MRLGLLITAALAFLAPGAVPAAEPEKAAIELRSDYLVAGMPLAESNKAVYGIRLTAQVDKQGEGRGTLELDATTPAYDEFGFWRGVPQPPVTLECTLKLVKKKKIQLAQSGRIGAPLVDVEWVLLALQGPKITSRLYLATENKCWDKWARLLIHDADGKVRYAVHLTTPPPQEPCHPGCFPAGTAIRTPAGPQPIERLREGDVVTTVGPDGAAAPGTVAAVFTTTNRLVQVRTEAGDLVTTTTQPLALAGGGFRAAGELQAGDRVWRWDGRERRAVTVRSVAPTGREERVFNLILGEPVAFVADGFLVRSKPPAPVRAGGGAPDIPAARPQ
jgi:hypothetical protein